LSFFLKRYFLGEVKEYGKIFLKGIGFFERTEKKEKKK